MTPWKNGYYKMSGVTGFIKVDGNQALMLPMICYDYPSIEPWEKHTWTHGDYGPTCPRMKEASGADKYNMEITSSNALSPPSKGVLSEDGSKIHSFTVGMGDVIQVIEWISEEELKEIADARDDFKAPACPFYKEQPDNQGKLLWLSGPPGAGKSTTAQLLGRDEADFVYFEGDCVFVHVNPFVPVEAENPTLAAFAQPGLKNVPKEVVDAVVEMEPIMKLIEEGKFDQIDLDQHPNYYKCMAECVAEQKKRLGGNFAVAHAVASRKMRDYIRTILPDCIFIVMEMSKECQEKRIAARHGEASEAILDFCTTLYKLYESKGENEPNTIRLVVEDGMSPLDVKSKVLEELSKLD